MARRDLEETWVPRIGEEAFSELRRYRKIGFAAASMPVLGGGASLLFGTAAGDLIGSLLLLAAVCIFAAFFRSQMRLAAALSRWFGVRIRGVPRMYPERFDVWCEKRGLQAPPEKADRSANAQSPTAPS
jgi:hypothetical protein